MLRDGEDRVFGELWNKAGPQVAIPLRLPSYAISSHDIAILIPGTSNQVSPRGCPG